MINILKLLFCIIFINFAYGQGDAPPLLQGQLQTSKSVGATIQSPNSQITKINSSTALIETGNKNILINPSFENKAVAGAIPGWTCSGITPIAETTVLVDGKSGVILPASSSTFECYQDSLAYNQYTNGLQFLAMMMVRSSATGTSLQLCSRSAGVTSSSNCVNILGATTGQFNRFKVPFIGSLTSNGISIKGVSVTGNIYIDDAFVGPVDLKQEVDQSRIAGEAYFAGTSGCQWTRASSTLGAFNAVAACPGPTIVRSSMGEWQTTDSDLPRVTVNNLPAGTYKAKFLLRQFMTATTTNPVMSINDGSSSCEPIYVNDDGNAGAGQLVECTFSYNSSGNRVFELYSASPSSTVNIGNTATAPRASTKFILEYFGNGSVYSSTNADTDWANCGHTTSSFTGFGTVSAIETQCKRQGGDLLMKGKFTSGTSTAVEARLSLPVWNGVQLVSAGTSIIPSIQISGYGVIQIASTSQYVNLIESSVAYITFSQQQASGAGLTKLTGVNFLGNNNTYAFQSRIPIEGWQNSNIIIGQFNGLESCTDSFECEDIYSARVSAAGVVTEETPGDWINGSATQTTGAFTVPFVSGRFTVAPHCWAEIEVNTTGWMAEANTTTSSQVLVKTSQGISASSGAFTLYCRKQGADYIGKTAKAVASDQNTRTTGAINTELSSFSFGTGVATTVCSASPCSYLNQIGGLITSVTRSGAGSYTFNFSKTFQKIKCSGNAAGGVSMAYDAARCESCSSVSTVSRNTSSGVGTDSYGTFICHLEN